MYIGNRDSTRVLPPSMMIARSRATPGSIYSIMLDERGVPGASRLLATSTPNRSLIQVGRFVVAENVSQIAVYEISPEGTLEGTHITTTPNDIVSFVSIARTPTPNRFITACFTQSIVGDTIAEFKINQDGTITQTGALSNNAYLAVRGSVRDARYVNGGKYIAVIQREILGSNISRIYTLSISGDEDNKVFDVVDSATLTRSVNNTAGARVMYTGATAVDGLYPVSTNRDEVAWIDSDGSVHSHIYSNFTSIAWQEMGFDRLSRMIHCINRSNNGRVTVSSVQPDGSVGSYVATATDNVAILPYTQDISSEYGLLSGASEINSGTSNPCTVKIMADGSSVLLGKLQTNLGAATLYCPQGHRPNDL